ncbi:MAG: M12 family metallopeptidase [Deltaproteobacteria bacterium]
MRQAVFGLPLFLSILAGITLLGGGTAAAQTSLFVSSDPDVICTTLLVQGGQVIFEGDMIVGRCEQDARGAWSFAPEGPIGDAIIGHAPRAAFRETATWPRGIMPYVIDSSLAASPDVLQDIGRAIRHWKDVAGVELIPRTTETSYVKFQAGSGCSSAVGRTGSEQPINLASNGSCGFGATVHEIGHAFGFWHEQSRQDRDDYVAVAVGNVSTTACGGGDCSHNFNKYGLNWGQDFSGYDYGSIMHYSGTAFGIGSPAADTIVPLEPAFADWQAIHGNIKIGFRAHLSTADGAAAQNFREACLGGTATGAAHWETSAWSGCSTGCPTGLRTREAYCIDAAGGCVAESNCVEGMPELTDECTGLTLTCDFENDACGWDHRETGDGFDWVVGQGPGESRGLAGIASYSSGPAADHTVGTDDGTYYYLDTLRRFKMGQEPAAGEEAHLTSYPLDIPAGATLSFWYHGHGAQCRNAKSQACTTDADCALWTGPAICDAIPGAELQSISCSTGVPEVLWSSQNESPVSQDSWRQATVTLSAGEGLRLRFVGAALPGYDHYTCSEGGNKCTGDNQCFGGSTDLCVLRGTRTSYTDSFALDDIVLSPESSCGSSQCQTEVAQTKNQQKCINTMNAFALKVAKLQGKESLGCVKNAGKGKLPTGQTIAECEVADAKGKMAKLAAKLQVAQDGEPDHLDKTKCPAPKPDFAYVDGAVLVAAVAELEREFASSILGDDADAVVIDVTDKANKKLGLCQQTMLKSTDKILQTQLKEFIKCKKIALKNQTSPVLSAVGLEICMAAIGDDAKGKVEKARVKTDDLFARKCTEEGHALDAVLAGACAAGAADIASFSTCVVTEGACIACRMMNAADDLNADCDLVDDGVDNASCGELTSSPSGSFLDYSQHGWRLPLPLGSNRGPCGLNS